MLSTGQAFVYIVVLGAVIFFCRALPFIIFRDGKDEEKAGGLKSGPEPDPRSGACAPGGFRRSKKRAFLAFVENTAPPVAMTVLAVNSFAVPVKEALESMAGLAGQVSQTGPVGLAELSGIALLGASAVLTAALHLWKRNALLSIFSGTALYMALGRFF